MKTNLAETVLLIGASLACLCTTGHSDDQSLNDSWVNQLDRPTRSQIVDLGPSKLNRYAGGHLRVTLSCFYYPNFMIKELHDGSNKGNESAAIVPVTRESVPDCKQPSVPGEVSLGPPDWEGDYFAGAKGKLLFFVWSDGGNGGFYFAVVDVTTRKKIYEDVFYDSAIMPGRPNSSLFDQPRVITSKDGSISLKYLRVKAFECDLYHPKKQRPCWEKIRMQAGIRNRQIPACSGYEQIHVEYPSAVAYPVEVSLRLIKPRKTIDGPARCWPAD